MLRAMQLSASFEGEENQPTYIGFADVEDQLVMEYDKANLKQSSRLLRKVTLRTNEEQSNTFSNMR